MQNIFGTEDEDDDNICKILNNYQSLAEIGVGFTSAVSVGIRINTDEKSCEEETTYILEKVSSFSILNDATNTVSSFHKKLVE